MGAGRFRWFVLRQRMSQSSSKAITDFPPARVISFDTSAWSMLGRPSANLATPGRLTVEIPSE